MSSSVPVPALSPRVRSAMVSDCLDVLGVRRNAMASTIRPLDGAVRAFGRASTVTLVPADDVVDGPYDAMIAFLDSLTPGSVAVVATGGSVRSACWGELFSAAAIGRGCCGVVCDGPLRDTAQIRGLKFPAFGSGYVPYDLKGRLRVAAVAQDVVCGDVAVRDGDLVLADVDGVVVIPQPVEDEVLELAAARADTESSVLAELQAGASVADVWHRHGVL